MIEVSQKQLKDKLISVTRIDRAANLQSVFFMNNQGTCSELRDGILYAYGGESLTELLINDDQYHSVPVYSGQCLCIEF